MKNLFVAAALAALAAAAPALCPAQQIWSHTPEGYYRFDYNGCYGHCVDRPAPGPGPEVTGNYANRYLPSDRYPYPLADPMFYHGNRALSKWRAIRPYGPATTAAHAKAEGRVSAPAALPAAQRRVTVTTQQTLEK